MDDNERIRESLDAAFRIQTSSLFKESDTGPGYVYLVRVHNLFKVGIAKNVKLRLSQMQVGCPYDIELVSRWYCINPSAQEDRLHRMLRQWQFRGEWFALPDAVSRPLSMVRHLHNFNTKSSVIEASFEAPIARYALL